MGKVCWLFKRDAKNQAKYWVRVISPYPGYMLDIESGYFDMGKGTLKWLVIAVDVFTSKVAIRAVPDLKAKMVDTPLKSILDEFGPVVEHIRIDGGGRYSNRTVASMLKHRKINYIFSCPPHKSNYTIYKIIQQKGNPCWQKYVQHMVASYNNQMHRSVGMAPNQVSHENVADL